MNVEDFFAQMMQKENKTVESVQEMIKKKENVGPEGNSTLDSSRKKLQGQSIYSNDQQGKSTIEYANAQDLMQKIQRDVNCLSAEDTQTRTKAIRRIAPTIQQAEKEVLEYIFPLIHNSIIPLIQDKLQYSRESSIAMILSFLKAFVNKKDEEKHEDYIKEIRAGKYHYQTPTHEGIQQFVVEEHFPLLFTVLPDVMEYDGVNPKEPSEIMREHSMELLYVIACHYHCRQYLNELMNCVRFAFQDKSGTLKLLAAKLLRVLVRDHAPALHGGEGLKVIVDDIKYNLTHKYASVREYTLKGMYYLMNIKPASEKLNDIENYFRKLAIDANPRVKETLVHVCENWFIYHDDSYSYQHVFVIPLLMLIGDKIESISIAAQEALERMGEYYEKWNADKLKDRQEYVYEDLSIEWSDLPKPLKRRPRLGARMVVKHNFKKIITFITEESPSWSVRSRETVANLERIAIVYTERDIVQHVEKLSTNWFSVVNDDEMDVREAWQASIQIAGRWLDVDAYLPLIIAHFHAKWASSPTLVTNVLTTLNLLLKGNMKKKDIHEKAVDLANSLSTPHLVYHKHVAIPLNMMTVIETIVNTIEPIQLDSMVDDDQQNDRTFSIVYQYLLLTLRLTANMAKTYPLIEGHHFMNPMLTDLNPMGSVNPRHTSSSPKVVEAKGSQAQQIEMITTLFQQSSVVRHLLANKCGVSLPTLYNNVFPRFMDDLAKQAILWDRASEDLATFEFVVVEAVATSNDASMVFDKIKLLTQANLTKIHNADETVHDERVSHFYQPKEKGDDAVDPYVICRMFHILWVMITKLGSRLSEDMVMVLLRDIISPNLVWRHGPLKRLTRQMAYHILSSMFDQSKLLTSSHLDFIAKELHGSLLSACDEHAVISRRIGASLFLTYYELISPRLTMEQQANSFDMFKGMLDDEHDDVRMAACHCLAAYFRDVDHSSAPSSFTIIASTDDDEALSKLSPFVQIVTLMLIHIDDPNEQMQDAVYRNLQALASSNSSRAAYISKATQSALSSTNFQQAKTRKLLESLLIK